MPGITSVSEILLLMTKKVEDTSTKKDIDVKKKMNKKCSNMIIPLSTSNQINGSWPSINHFV